MSHLVTCLGSGRGSLSLFWNSAVDVVVEAWSASRDATRLAAGFLKTELAARCRKLEIFGTTEWVKKNRAVPTTHGRSPGVKYIARCYFHDDLPESAAQRSWNLHVPLALRVHVGVCKYVRNWVEEPLPLASARCGALSNCTSTAWTISSGAGSSPSGGPKLSRTQVISSQALYGCLRVSTLCVTREAGIKMMRNLRRTM